MQKRIEASRMSDNSKKEECLLDKPHASDVSIERKLIEKCQCPKHKASGGEKELPKRENGLNHTHGINGEPTVHHSKRPEPCKKKETCPSYHPNSYICTLEPKECIENYNPNEPREDEITEQLKRCEACKKQMKMLNNYEFILDFLQELESINAFITIIKTKLEEKLK